MLSYFLLLLYLLFEFFMKLMLLVCKEEVDESDVEESDSEMEEMEIEDDVMVLINIVYLINIVSNLVCLVGFNMDGVIEVFVWMVIEIEGEVSFNNKVNGYKKVNGELNFFYIENIKFLFKKEKVKKGRIFNGIESNNVENVLLFLDFSKWKWKNSNV